MQEDLQPQNNNFSPSSAQPNAAPQPMVTGQFTQNSQPNPMTQPVTTAPVPTAQSVQPAYPGQPQQQYAPAPVEQTNGLAIAALITGLLGMGLIALILGILGLKKPGGRGMSIAGIVLGSIEIVFGGLYLLLVIFAAANGMSSSATTSL